MKTGCNDPCPCGSGKKYKKCKCGLYEATQWPQAKALEHARAEKEAELARLSPAERCRRRQSAMVIASLAAMVMR